MTIIITFVSLEQQFCLAKRWLFYQAWLLFLAHEASVINDRINPFFSSAIRSSQSSGTWDETRAYEA
jgi:hypothetical protein